MNLETILVIGEVCADDEPLALRKAVKLAQQQPIAIHFLSVVYCESDSHESLLDEQTQESIKQELGSIQQRLISQKQNEIKLLLASEVPPTVEVSYEVVWSADLFETVRNVCEQRQVDLIIKTGHRSESLIHVPTDFHLLHFSHVPVLIRRIKKWASKPVVLAKIEFAPANEQKMALNNKILRAAVMFARLRGADLHACHIIPCSKVLMDLDFMQEEYLVDKFCNKYRDKMIEYGKEFGIEPGKLHVRAGPPAKAVTTIANNIKADLVVNGAQKEPSRIGHFFGSTNEKLLSILRTDVMTIKPD